MDFFLFSWSNPFHVLTFVALIFLCWKKPAVEEWTANFMFNGMLPYVMSYAILGCVLPDIKNFIAIHMIIITKYGITTLLVLYCCWQFNWKQWLPEILIASVRPNVLPYLIVAPFILGLKYYGPELPIESILSSLFTVIVLLLFSPAYQSKKEAFNKLFYRPIILTIIGFTVLRLMMEAVGMSCPYWILESMRVPTSWCGPLAIVVILAAMKTALKEIKYETIGPIFFVTILCLVVSPWLTSQLCQMAGWMGCLEKSSADRLTLLYGMACSTSAYLWFKTNWGKADLYAVFVVVVSAASIITIAIQYAWIQW